MCKHKKRKGGVYLVFFPWDKYNPKYQDSNVIKIGHSQCIKCRFQNYNTIISDGDAKDHIVFIIHSENQAFSGSWLLEKITHKFFNSFRHNREFFKLPDNFNLYDYEKQIKDEFELHNITDIQFFENFDTIPYTIFPTTYDIKNEHESLTIQSFKPFERQIEPIDKIIKYFKQSDSGGLYYACGVGKTYISIFASVKMNMKKVIIFTHRLTIIREWEKVLNGLNLPCTTVDSEMKYDLEKCKETSFLYIITTYQTYIQKRKKFEKTYDFIIHDEAHVLESGTEFSKCLKLKGKKLFLTATPSIHFFDENHDSIQKTELTEAKYGKAIDQISIHDAIDRGILCHYRLLLFNSPLESCFEHVQVLNQEYGRNKIIVFYNRCEDAKNAVNLLNENGLKNVFYIDGETSRFDREEIFQKFEKLKFSVIVNVNVLCEGISIPCVDCILIMDKRNSNRTLIQMIGRALRKYKKNDVEKECSLICFPTDCVDSIETALTALSYDAKNTNRVQSNILTHVSTKEKRDNILKDVNMKLLMISCELNGLEGLVDLKMKLLNEIVIREGKLVAFSLIVNGLKLGGFQDTLIQTIKGSKLFSDKLLSKWKLKYPELFGLINERVNKILEKNETKDISTPTEKIELLNNAVIKNKKLIFRSYEINNIKLGRFQDKLIQSVLGNQIKKYYEKELPLWEEKYPYLFKLINERVNKIKESSELKLETSPSEKMELLNIFFLKNNKLVSFSFVNEDGIKLGSFLDTLIQSLMGNQNCYKNDIHEWRQKYSNLFILIDKRVATNKKRKEKRVVISLPEKIKKLNDIVVKNMKLLIKNYEIDGVALGMFQHTLIQSISGNNNCYKNDIPKWRILYPKLFELIDKRIKK